MTIQDQQPHLKKGVGLIGVVTFGAGTAIGVSIFSVLSPAAKVAGSGLLVTVVLAAFPMVLFAVIYSFLSSALPKSGASYEWPRRFLHPSVGFLVAWLRIFSNVGAIVVLAMVLVSYVSAVFPLPLKPTMAAIITAVFLLNYLGVQVAARVQTLLMLALLMAFGAFVWFGVPKVHLETVVGSLLAPGWGRIAAALPLMISLFLGIESAAEIGEEVEHAERTIPRGIALAIALTAIVYIAISATALGLIGPERLAASSGAAARSRERRDGAPRRHRHLRCRHGLDPENAQRHCADVLALDLRDGPVRCVAAVARPRPSPLRHARICALLVCYAAAMLGPFPADRA